MTITHLDAREHLVRALRYDLVGPMLDDELIEQRPTRWYLTGFLVPKGASEEDSTDPLGDEELGSGPVSDADDDGEADAGAAPRGWFPSSFGLSVLVPAAAPTLRVTLRWGEYTQLDAAASLARWQAHQPERLAAIQKPPRARPGEQAAPEKVRSPPPLWQRKAHTATFDVPITSRPHPIPGAPGLRLHVQARPTLAPGLLPDTNAVSVFLVNEREPLEGARADERALFQVELEVACESGLVARTDWTGAEADDADAARTDLQYRDHGEWAVGHGVATLPVAPRGGPGSPTVSEPPGGPRLPDPVTTVVTTWLPEARVRRMEAVAVPGVPLEMETLAALPDAAALQAAVGPMLDAYADWLGRRANDTAGLTGRRRDAALALLARADTVRERIAKALTWLGTDDAAFKCFQITNLAMSKAAEQARPGAYAAGGKRPTWRLFQLAFLLLNVQSMGDGRHPDREVVELLFFPTGGGKTEAYLGVAAFTMLLRRRRGAAEAHEGAGVAVLLRYTLRLLTLDQLSRAATLVCALEVLRRAAPESLGRRRFSIGLWVGRSGTKNRMADAEKDLSLYKSNPKDPRRAPGVPLTACPWCTRPFTPDSFAIEKRNSKPWALRVACVDDDCPFHRDNSEGIGVPVAVVDEQVYRELPTFLLATVDKFAMLPWRGAAGSLFGKVSGSDGDGWYGIGDPLPSTARRLPDGLLPPELIIQDELHLITGPLGTMVGLYETAILAFCTREGVGPKIVASTATARRATQQIRALYGRPLVEVFPPPGIDASDSFFSRTDYAETATRLYVGVAAPGRSMKAIAVRVYSVLLAAAYKDWRRGATGAANPADTYCTMVAYFNTLRELGGAQRLVQEEVNPRAGRLDERHAIQERASPWCQSRHLNFDVLELTSRQSTDQIRQTTTKLRAPYQSPDGGRNDVLLASSMISVGVDIPRLGLMVMNGQPRTVAEYIQATSRVGRETPGLVVTVHNLRRPRDRSHYERFLTFHDGFYRMVEAASVTPFSSRAIDRGLAGITVALARHGWRPLTPSKAVDRLDGIAGVPKEVAGIVAARARQHTAGASPLLVAHVQQRIHALFSDWSAIVHALQGGGVPLVYSPLESAGESLLSTAIDPPSPKDARLVRFRAPMSMRDVEPGVHLWVERDLGGEEP